MTAGKATRSTVGALAISLKEVAFVADVRRLVAHVLDDIMAVSALFSKVTAALCITAMVKAWTKHLRERDKSSSWSAFVLTTPPCSLGRRRLRLIGS